MFDIIAKVTDFQEENPKINGIMVKLKIISNK